MKILVTGGAGFIGYNIISYLSTNYPNYNLIAFDNLKRLGSESNLVHLKNKNIQFVHGDIRNTSELYSVGNVDLVIHCASNPSVLAGITDSSELVIQNNLIGSINVFEFTSQQQAKIIFLSSNRVYDSRALNNLSYIEKDTRLVLSGDQLFEGVSENGISEKFSTSFTRTFYGTTKLCSELLLQEYAEYRELKYIINRFGVVSGKGQFGTQDQGIISFWLKKHLKQESLSYFGYGGKGKQVRDVLHILDLCEILDLQLKNIDNIHGETFNIGGGFLNSFSLMELTERCQAYTGNVIQIKSVKANRSGDIPIYYTDNTKILKSLKWAPRLTLDEILEDLLQWYRDNHNF